MIHHSISGFTHTAETKVNIFQRVRSFFSSPKAKKRGFFAATLDRLTSGWATNTGQIDRDLRGDIAALRSRARELAKNNDYAKKYLRLLKQNVIGSEGFVLQVRSYDTQVIKNKPIKRLDEYANRIIEEHFYRWGDEFNADITGKLTFRKLMEVALISVVRDGEVFIRKIVNREVNRYGFTLQLIPSDYIDHTYTAELNNGNYI